MAIDFPAQLNDVNQLGCWEWQLRSFDGHELCLVGGTDMDYYHVAEVRIAGVSYVSCPTRMKHPTFRPATQSESWRLASIVDLVGSPVLLAIDAETSSSVEPLSFFIVGETLEVVRGTVYYYDRPNLQPGERLAPWVKRNGG